MEQLGDLIALNIFRILAVVGVIMLFTYAVAIGLWINIPIYRRLRKRFIQRPESNRPQDKASEHVSDAAGNPHTLG